MTYKGTVKFYNKEKGFGFIFSRERTSDAYFSINDWKNGSVPNGNDEVEFEMQTQANGKEKAINIKLIQSNYDKNKSNFTKNDDRITCPSCRKKIVPRLVTYRGRATHSLCPYCASRVNEYGYCFIATAIYKDYDHPQVMVLRDFRDKYLLTNKTGKTFVKYYYQYSPKFANYIKDRSLISFPIKKVLDFFVFVLKKI